MTNKLKYNPKRAVAASVAVLLALTAPVIAACKVCGTIDPKDMPGGNPNVRNCDKQLPNCNDAESGKQSCDYSPTHGGGLVTITCDVVNAQGQVTGQTTITAMNCDAFGNACP